MMAVYMVEPIDKNALPELHQSVPAKNKILIEGRIWKWLKALLPIFILNIFNSMTKAFINEAPPIKAKEIELTTFQDKDTCFAVFKEKVLGALSKQIENQRQNKTYKRSKLEAIDEKNQNKPIPLKSAPKGIDHFAKNATYFSYNSEGIRDYGWGCAWRAIQTCLSSYKVDTNFEKLFHLFGSQDNINAIYKEKYPDREVPTKVFAPYTLGNGWAEPFIGHMTMHFFNIDSSLEAVNAVPRGSSAPKEVFHNKALDFSVFKERLLNHFKHEAAAPVMIDDSLWASNIIGIGTEGEFTTLWIADPHIKEKMNGVGEEGSTVGLYTVVLDGKGKQVSCSLDKEDQANKPKMFSSGSYGGLDFESKSWMALFPKPV